MNYEKIIIELGNKIAQLSIDNAVLVSRAEEEQKAKEEVEKKYIEACTELRHFKDRAGIVEAQGAIKHE